MPPETRRTPGRKRLTERIRRLARNTGWMIDAAGARPPGPEGEISKESAAFGGFRCRLLLSRCCQATLLDTLSDRRVGCVPAAMCRPIAEWYLRSLFLHQVLDAEGSRAYLAQEGERKRMPRLDEAIKAMEGSGSDEAGHGERADLVREIRGQKDWLHEQVHGGRDLLAGGASREVSERVYSDAKIEEIVHLLAGISFSAGEMLLLLSDADSMLVNDLRAKRTGFFGAWRPPSAV